MANDKKVYENKNAVIHGGLYRALQFGYGGYQQYTKVPDEFNPPPQTVDGKVQGATASPHGHGIPAFTMWIRAENFVRTLDRKVGCTITKACLQQFPMWPDGSPYDRPVQPTEVKEGQPKVTSVDIWGAVPPQYRIGNHEYDTYAYDFIRTFYCPFTISAALYSGNTRIATTTLFHKSGSTGRWRGPSDYPTPAYAADFGPNVGITKPVELRGKVANFNDPVTLVILNYSQCSCDQTDKYRAVFSADITEYIPPIDPYIWRRFGNNKTEDPVGNTINPEKLDGKWHLVRPIYLSDGTRWKDIEEDFLG